MIKKHTVAATIVAAAIGSAVVIGAYALIRKGQNESPAILTIRRSTNPEIAAVSKTARVKTIETAQSSANAAPKNIPDKIVDLKNIPSLPSNLPDKAELQEQFKMLRSFLELPPERLAKIHSSIEKIEAMPPEQKARLLYLIRKNDKPYARDTNTATSVAHANELLAAMPAEIRALLAYRTKGYTPERRATFIEGYAAACKDAASRTPKPQATVK